MKIFPYIVDYNTKNSKSYKYFKFFLSQLCINDAGKIQLIFNNNFIKRFNDMLNIQNIICVTNNNIKTFKTKPD